MSFFDNIKQKADSLTAEASKLADKTIKNLNELASETSKKVSDTASDITTTVSDRTNKTTKETSERVNQSVKGTYNLVNKTVKDVTDWSTKAVDDTTKRINETVDSITAYASESWENKEKYSQDLKNWTNDLPEKIKDYTENFNIEDFWNKIVTTAKSVGQDMIFMALTIYYTLREWIGGNDEDKQIEDIKRDATTKIIVKAKVQNRGALGIINAYLKLLPDTTIECLRATFPTEIAPDNGVEQIFEREEMAMKLNSKMALYLTKPEQIIKLANGENYCLSSIWSKKSLENLSNKAKEYGVTLVIVGMSPNSIGYELGAINA